MRTTRIHLLRSLASRFGLGLGLGIVIVSVGGGPALAQSKTKTGIGDGGPAPAPAAAPAPAPTPAPAPATLKSTVKPDHRGVSREVKTGQPTPPAPTPPAPPAPTPPAPTPPAPTPPATSTPAAPSGGEAALPGEREATDCKAFKKGATFKWDIKGEVDLQQLLGWFSPLACRPFVVPGNIRQSKVTIVAPNLVTMPEAYRMFLSALEAMGLTVQPEGKVLKIVETNRARESAIPIITQDERTPSNDSFVTRMLRLQHAELNDVKQVLDRLKSKDGDITMYAPTSTLIITDLGTNIRKMEEVIGQLDVPMGGERIYTIKLHTVSATEMANLLQQVFGVGKGASGTSAPGQPAGGKGRIQMGIRSDSSSSAAAAAAAPGGAASGAGDGGASLSQIIPDDPRQLLIIVGTERAYQRVLALVRRIDQITNRPAGESVNENVHVVPLANANADDVAGTLGGLGAGVSRGGGSAGRPGAAPPPPAPGGGAQPQRTGLFEGEVRIASDKPTNSLVIIAQGRDWVTVRDLIRKLDIPRRQVFVEAVILEISVDKARKLGTGFHAGGTVGSGDTQSLIFGGSIPNNEVNSLVFNPSALSGLAAGVRGPPIPEASTILGLPPGASIPSFGVFVQALQNNGDVNVISMPHILTTDNEKATIQVGQNLPFPGSLGGFPGFGGVPGSTGTTVPGASFGFGTSVQRQDVALKLEITPHVNDSDFVRLELDNEISDVANPNFNGLGPATAKRTVKSVVTVRDQQSIVIGGLIKDRVEEQVDKVPLLGDIPILGYLFKRTRKTVLKQNLLIILTPYVVKDPNDLRRIFERKLRERREFMERYSAFRDERDFEAEVDYRRKRGLLEEINLTALEAEREAADLRAAEAALRGRDLDGVVEIGPPPPPRRLLPPGAPGASTVPDPMRTAPPAAPGPSDRPPPPVFVPATPQPAPAQPAPAEGGR
jgi:general secretion pathway protein D